MNKSKTNYKLKNKKDEKNTIKKLRIQLLLCNGFIFFIPNNL